MAHVFITRALTPGDALVERLRAAGHRVTGHALLRFTALPPGDVPAADWVFAYSATGVTLMDDATVARLRRARPRVAAMGRRTAGAFAARGFAVDFEGAGSPAAVAQAFRARLRAEVPPASGDAPESLPESHGRHRVLFVRASESRRSVQLALAGDVLALDLVTYRNEVDPAAAPVDPDADVLYLTSPLNARAALRPLSPATAPTLWCIGPTTLAAVRELGFPAARLAPAALRP